MRGHESRRGDRLSRVLTVALVGSLSVAGCAKTSPDQPEVRRFIPRQEVVKNLGLMSVGMRDQAYLAGILACNNGTIERVGKGYNLVWTGSRLTEEDMVHITGTATQIARNGDGSDEADGFPDGNWFRVFKEDIATIVADRDDNCEPYSV